MDGRETQASHARALALLHTLYGAADRVVEGVAELLARGIEVKRLGAALRRAKAEVDLWEDV